MIVRWCIVNKEWNTVEGPYGTSKEAEKAIAAKKDGCCWILVPAIDIPYPDVES